MKYYHSVNESSERARLTDDQDLDLRGKMIPSRNSIRIKGEKKKRFFFLFSSYFTMDHIPRENDSLSTNVSFIASQGGHRALSTATD